VLGVDGAQELQDGPGRGVGATCDPGLSQQSCDAAKAIGGGIGALLIVFLWVAADVILGIIWLVTRKREPQVVYVQQAAAQPHN
jgi:hypothetical protein